MQREASHAARPSNVSSPANGIYLSPVTRTCAGGDGLMESTLSETSTSKDVGKMHQSSGSGGLST